MRKLEKLIIKDFVSQGKIAKKNFNFKHLKNINMLGEQIKSDSETLRKIKMRKMKEMKRYLFSLQKERKIKQPSIYQIYQVHYYFFIFFLIILFRFYYKLKLSQLLLADIIKINLN